MSALVQESISGARCNQADPRLGRLSDALATKQKRVKGIQSSSERYSRSTEVHCISGQQLDLSHE
jgi:hypothetical protein